MSLNFWECYLENYAVELVANTLTCALLAFHPTAILTPSIIPTLHPETENRFVLIFEYIITELIIQILIFRVKDKPLQ